MMKIEIGESLVYSWLRHIEQCQIVQMNWKPSPIWEKQDIDLIPLKEEIENKFKDSNLDLFKKTSNMDQFFRQAEIDAVGVSYHDNGNICYFVDVAFHENGLNYGSKDETISRILKKYIRSYFIFLTYFSDFKDVSIYFISPKVSLNSICNPLEENLGKLTEVFNENGHNPKFETIVNDDFNNEVLNPIIAMSNDIADTNELFLRSVQLWKLFENKPKQKPPEKKPPLIEDKTNTDVIKEKIGKHVQGCLHRLVNDQLINDDEIIKLLNPEYSKKVFGLGFSFLRRQHEGRLDGNGRIRYYAKIWKINGSPYYFCSQWYEKQWSQFDTWFDEIKFTKTVNG